MRIRALALLLACAAPLVAAPPAQASDPLSPEQQALLGCGPLVGIPCARGIDVTAADAGVLTQAWVGFEGAYTSGYRQVGGVRFVDGLLIPSGFLPSGSIFASELAAVSYNAMLLLVAFSSRGEGPGELDPDNPYAHYDPNDPSTAANQGQCSFLQPQYCSSVQSYFDISPPAPPPPKPAIAPNGRGRAASGGSAKRAGCLPPARGLASLSGRPAPDVGRRAGRCPKR